MGAYKFYNPSTEQWEIIKSKSIIKDDGSLEYTPDDIEAIDNKIGILNGIGDPKEKANKTDLTTLSTELTTHKADYASLEKAGHIKARTDVDGNLLPATEDDFGVIKAKVDESGKLLLPPTTSYEQLSEITLHTGEEANKNTTHTIFDIIGSGSVVGGLISGYDLGSNNPITLTIDGVDFELERTVCYTSASTNAFYYIVVIPPISFNQSAKLVFKTYSTTKRIGYQVYTKTEEI